MAVPYLILYLTNNEQPKAENLLEEMADFAENKTLGTKQMTINSWVKTRGGWVGCLSYLL